MFDRAVFTAAVAVLFEVTLVTADTLPEDIVRGEFQIITEADLELSEIF